MGAVLLQKKGDGKKHPIAYYSATLNAAERNYDIYDLELLAISQSTRPLETIPSRITTQSHHILRPPKPHYTGRTHTSSVDE